MSDYTMTELIEKLIEIAEAWEGERPGAAFWIAAAATELERCREEMGLIPGE